MSEKVSIIIAHHNEPDYLNLYLQSIRVNSRNNLYETIIVNTGSESEKAQRFISLLKDEEDVSVVESESETYRDAILDGLGHVSEDSGYLIFSHSDNVVLNPQWLDFMIGQSFSDDKFGGIIPGPTVKFTGPGGQMVDGPNYNFLFTERNLFEKIGFAYRECENIGLVLGYRHQLQEMGKNLLMADAYGFMHHYGLKKISDEEKEKDVEKFNKTFVERVQKYSTNG